jgi:hypothetical protein
VEKKFVIEIISYKILAIMINLEFKINFHFQFVRSPEIGSFNETFGRMQPTFERRHFEGQKNDAGSTSNHSFHHLKESPSVQRNVEQAQNG